MPSRQNRAPPSSTRAFMADNAASPSSSSSSSCVQVDDDLFERFGTALIDLSPQGDERVRVEPAGEPQLATRAVEGEGDGQLGRTGQVGG